jgi:hypothetical protein
MLVKDPQNFAHKLRLFIFILAPIFALGPHYFLEVTIFIPSNLFWGCVKLANNCLPHLGKKLKKHLNGTQVF